MKNFSVLNDYNPDEVTESQDYNLEVNNIETNQVNNEIINESDYEMDEIINKYFYITPIYTIILILMSISAIVLLDKELNFENLMIFFGLYNLLLLIFIFCLCFSYKITDYITKKVNFFNYTRFN